jgi:hypothetical protein
MGMFPIPYKAVLTVELLSVIFASFVAAVENLNVASVAATFFVVACHLVHY